MTEKFTKGPWSVEFDHNVVTMSNNKHIKPIPSPHSSGFGVNYNSYLIAMAPDMYEMLKDLSEMMPFLDEQTHPQIEMDAVKCEIDQLLAKARGEG